MLIPIRRRSFLQRSPLIALAPTIPTFLKQPVGAAESAHDGRILVVIQLSGGNDGINTVIPHADEGYAKHRRQLRLPANDLIRVNDAVALHPSLRGMADLLEDNQLAIVQGVGYPNPNRSHDVSMSIWQTARFQESEHRSARVDWARDGSDSAPPATAASHTMLVGDETTPIAIVGRRSVASSLGNLSEMTRAAGVQVPTAAGRRC